MSKTVFVVIQAESFDGYPTSTLIGSKLTREEATQLSIEAERVWVKEYGEDNLDHVDFSIHEVKQ